MPIYHHYYYHHYYYHNNGIYYHNNGIRARDERALAARRVLAAEERVLETIAIIGETGVRFVVVFSLSLGFFRLMDGIGYLLRNHGDMVLTGISILIGGVMMKA